MLPQTRRAILLRFRGLWVRAMCTMPGSWQMLLMRWVTLHGRMSRAHTARAALLKVQEPSLNPLHQAGISNAQAESMTQADITLAGCRSIVNLAGCSAEL